VLQVAGGHFAPQKYHDSIGFEVSKDLLERAFQLFEGAESFELWQSGIEFSAIKESAISDDRADQAHVADIFHRAAIQ
jgi:hypothetical protein